MTNNMYYVAEEKILNEIANEKKFSFRALLNLLTAGAISRKFWETRLLRAVDIKNSRMPQYRHADCTPISNRIRDARILRDGIKAQSSDHPKRFIPPYLFGWFFLLK